MVICGNTPADNGTAYVGPEINRTAEDDEAAAPRDTDLALFGSGVFFTSVSVLAAGDIVPAATVLLDATTALMLGSPTGIHPPAIVASAAAGPVLAAPPCTSRLLSRWRDNFLPDADGLAEGTALPALFWNFDLTVPGRLEALRGSTEWVELLDLIV